MKKLIALFAAIVLVSGLTSTVKAQVTANATGTATIISPIAIAKSGDMNFGSIAVSTNPGTVVLTTSSTRSATGGVTLPAVTGTISSASFTVTGLANSTYSILLPSSYLLTRLTGSETMNVTNFISTPSGTGTLTGGTQTISVGATLNVAGSQLAGTYTNAGGFPVTVNYN